MMLIMVVILALELVSFTLAMMVLHASHVVDLYNFIQTTQQMIVMSVHPYLNILMILEMVVSNVLDQILTILTRIMMTVILV